MLHRRTVTAVFTDLVGSTALASQLDPEVLRTLMGRYYEAMRAELERHSGRVEKFIGDAVVGLFGVPVVHEDDALRAVRAAAGMRRVLVDLNDELARAFDVQIDIRIGVNTGEVLAADVADHDGFTIGDPINVAARLQQYADPGEVLLGGSTYRLVRHAVIADRLPPLMVKGKEEALTAYRLVDIAEHAPSIPRRLDSPLVGRDHELRLAGETFQRVVRERLCHLFTIVGTAGVGKSRLAAEVTSMLEPRAAVLRGRCLSYGEGITFWPLVEILRGVTGSIDDHRGRILETLGELVEGEQDAALIAQRLGQIVGVVPGPIDADEILWAVRRFLETSARRRPLTVVIDDIHWAEPTFLDLVDHLVRWARDAPILLLCIARPEFLDSHPAWAGGMSNATTIRLGPLSDDESTRLMENLLDGAPLPDRVREQITAAAEGNPLFVEEMLGMLVDSAAVRRTEDGWDVAGELVGLAVPPSIGAVLGSRLDGLPSDERQVLEAAAVVGREFGRGAVTAVAPPELRLRTGPLLDQLLRKDLVVPEHSTVPGDDGFRFRHILIRDAAYGALPRAERADMHERFVEWLDATDAEPAGEIDEIAGYHLQQAHENRIALGAVDDQVRDLAGRAATRLLAAGHRALDRGDYRGALNLLERAYGLADDPGAELLLAYGMALANTGTLDRAAATLRAAIQAADRVGDERLSWHARIEEAIWRQMLDTGPGVASEILQVVPSAIPVFERLGDDTGAARAWITIASAHDHVGHHAQGLEAAERALAHAERAANEALVREAYRLIGVGIIWGPLPLAEGVRRYGNLVDRVEGGPLKRAATAAVVAALKAQLGEIDESRVLTARAREIYDEIGDPVSSATLALQEHRGPLGVGDFATAEAIVAEACATLDAAGERSRYSTAVAIHAGTLYGLGRFDEAYRATLASEAAGSEDDVVTQAYWRAERAKVLARWGRADEAVRLVHDALARIEATDGLLETADVYGALGEVMMVLGRRGEAKTAWSESIRRYEAKGTQPFAALMRGKLDRLES